MKKSQVKVGKNLRTWIEIDTGAIEHNVRSLKTLLSDDVSMMAVVKSNAYGHGMILSAKTLIRSGVDWLAVDEFSEAIELRKAGIKFPVLVLGFTLPELYHMAVQKNISITISSVDSLNTLVKSFAKSGKKTKKGGKKLKMHLKFDTGLHRQGILESHVQQVIRTVSSKDFFNIATVEGVYTHFAVMEDPSREDYSRTQAELFRSIVIRLKEKGFNPIAHASASSGIFFSPEYHFDMVRAGIAVYGLWPSPEISRHARLSKSGPLNKISLRPALTWKTIITEVKLVSRGSRIGYDLTHEVSRDSRIAIIPVGYWHGLPRSLSNCGQVLIGNKRANIIGRISMDMTIIDVTDIPTIKQGDEVTIIGLQGKDRVTTEELAEKAGTINYEIVTRINPLLPRIAL